MSNRRRPYKILAGEILELLGGEKNVIKVIHCITRLRFYLKDSSKADKEKIQNLSGVMGVVEAGGQYQVVIGAAVDEVYEEVVSQLASNEDELVEEDLRVEDVEEVSFPKKLGRAFNQLIGVITGSMSPVISILAASGIIKSILTLLSVSTSLITTDSNAFLIINAMADAVFYFLPIMIGFNAARRLDGNPTLTAVVAAVIIHPSILEAANKGLNILSIGAFNFPFISYTYSIFPMILAAWLVKKFEHFLKERIPLYVRSLVVPILVIGGVSAITFLVTGPVIMWLSLGLASAIEYLISLSAPIFGAIVDGFYQVLVIFGLHWGLIPLYVNDFATKGYSYFSAIVSVPAVAQGGAALAVAIKTRKAKVKELGYAGAISAFCAITEPAIYGINLRFKKPFICAGIASAVGGFLTGAFNINMWNIIGSVIGLPSYIDPVNGITSNFWYAVLVTIITLVLSFLLTYIWGYNDDMVMEEERKRPKNPAKKPA